jgi:hypothetical protein
VGPQASRELSAFDDRDPTVRTRIASCEMCTLMGHGGPGCVHCPVTFVSLPRLDRLSDRDPGRPAGVLFALAVNELQLAEANLGRLVASSRFAPTHR